MRSGDIPTYGSIYHGSNGQPKFRAGAALLKTTGFYETQPKNSDFVFMDSQGAKQLLSLGCLLYCLL